MKAVFLTICTIFTFLHANQAFSSWPSYQLLGEAQRRSSAVAPANAPAPQAPGGPRLAKFYRDGEEYPVIVDAPGEVSINMSQQRAPAGYRPISELAHPRGIRVPPEGVVIHLNQQLVPRDDGRTGPYYQETEDGLNISVDMNQVEQGRCLCYPGPNGKTLCALTTYSVLSTSALASMVILYAMGII